MMTSKTGCSLPEDDSERAELLMADGLLDYFPNALAEIARHSKLAGDKHHPGEPLHWERQKSTDHRNKILRHLVDSGKKDKDGNRHSTGLAWRALALLQEELEAEFGYPAPRNAVDPQPEFSDWEILYMTGKAVENDEHRQKLLSQITAEDIEKLRR